MRPISSQKNRKPSKHNATSQQESVNYPSSDLFTGPEFDALEASFQFNGTTFENQNDNIDSFFEKYLGDHSESTEYDSRCDNEDSEALELFQELPIEEWNGEECYDWASSIYRYRGLESTEVNIWNFRDTTGLAMLQLSLQEFCHLAGELYGPVLFQDFHNLRSRKKAMRLHRSHNKNEENTADWARSGKSHLKLPSHFLASSSSIPSSPSTPSSSSTSSSFLFPSSSYAHDSWKLSKEEFQELDKYIPKNEVWNALPEDILDLDIKSYSYVKVEEEDTYAEQIPLVSSTLANVASTAVSQNVKTTSRKGERKPKIYEFLMRLLVDETTNPDLIRWDDLTKGTFVLTQPDIIAQLWGARANKPNLSANNFARALRYHYNTGALVAVSEKHYMYKCGPKSLKYLLELKGDSSSSDDF